MKHITHWDATRIKREYQGTPAPDFHIKDLKGNTIALSDLRGKTVLLDFWATWCEPCRADAPALDKLQQNYGSKQLSILSISVNEDRDIVEKFLAKHPHDFPITLTTENDLPVPYHVHAIPTYIVIDPEGKISTVVQGTEGFGYLRDHLKRAGLTTD